MNLLDKLEKELTKVQKQLDKLHDKEQQYGLHGNGTMRKAKLHINIEYYCRQKDNIIRDIGIARTALLVGKMENTHKSHDTLILEAFRKEGLPVPIK